MSTSLQRYLVFGLLALTLFGARKARAASSTPPDILLIMPDQMRGDCLAAVGHPVLRTPTLDGLARAGALFRRAYTTCPSCIPARFALLTGQYPQTSGVVGYAQKPITTPTLPAVLSENGYTTVLVGRSMHQLPVNKTCGYQKQITGSTYVNSDEYAQYLLKVAPETGGIRKLVETLGLSNNGWRAKPWPLADELHPTAWIVSQSRQIVAETPAAQPLFLTTSFYAPHPPLFPPKKYYDAYLKADPPQPARGDWVDWQALSPQGDKAGHRVRLEGEALRAAEAGYFGLIEHLDAEIAPLVAEFQARSAKAGRPWLIIVVSDHGEMLGDHGYFRKCEPYEGSANIPFIVAGSPKLGLKTGLRVDDTPVCLEDVMPTLLAVAGAACPKAVDGVDLLPVLRGTKRVVRDYLHFEHATCYSAAQAFQALTDGRYKYIWRPADGTEQLFDLAQDPREEHDLARGAAQGPLLTKWRNDLVRVLAGRPEGFSDGAKLIAGRRYSPLYDVKGR